MVLIKMGVVTNLVQAGKPQTAKELSASYDADERLVGKSIQSAKEDSQHMN